MADDVARVARRCEEAKASHSLNLSACRLMRVPDAVYALLREIPLSAIQLQSNLLKKLTVKFTSSFQSLQELNVSQNRLTALPDEMIQMNQLKRFDLSSNRFSELPAVLFAMDSLEVISVADNAIVSVSVAPLRTMASLKEMNLEKNPLEPSVVDALQEMQTVKLDIVSDAGVKTTRDVTGFGQVMIFPSSAGKVLSRTCFERRSFNDKNRL
eukprot:m.195454 g.195454  ORF g.195454 m.195454 type:complete len:212 (+) comp39517_c0_seq72:37-672(+)